MVTRDEKVEGGDKMGEGDEEVHTFSYKSWACFSDDSDSKESACNVGGLGSMPGSGRSPGEGNGNPLQYSCLENSMERRAWRATVHGVPKSRTRLNNFDFHFRSIFSHRP